jgi:hypothetical protein
MGCPWNGRSPHVFRPFGIDAAPGPFVGYTSSPAERDEGTAGPRNLWRLPSVGWRGVPPSRRRRACESPDRSYSLLRATRHGKKQQRPDRTAGPGPAASAAATTTAGRHRARETDA